MRLVYLILAVISFADTSLTMNTSTSPVQALPHTKILRFNIGGHRFDITDDILKDANLKYFNAYLSGSFGVVLDEENRYFINGSVKVGKIIEHYLHYKTLLANADPEAIKVAVEFFGLPDEIKSNLKKEKWGVGYMWSYIKPQISGYQCNICQKNSAGFRSKPIDQGGISECYEHIINEHQGKLLEAKAHSDKHAIYFQYPINK